MMRLSMGYPAAESEKNLYFKGDRRALIRQIQAVGSPESVLQWQAQVRQITVSEAIADYVYRLVSATRRTGLFTVGLSPRAGLAVVNAAKAWAFLDGRDFVVPEDVKAVWLPVTNHRVQSLQQQGSRQLLAEILEYVAA